MTDESIAARIERLVAEEHDLRTREQVDREAVSYTHLTLPTTPYV